MKKNLSIRVKTIKEAIQAGVYDWDTAITSSAEKIASYPEALLWR